jgi:gliding motility-associated-like protein
MTTRAIHILFVLLSFSAVLLHAQKQNNQWRFGRTGVDFNSKPPLNTPGIPMLAQEGSASVADKNTGKLLFYTDGVTVWNAEDQPMPNGTGLSGGSVALLSSTTAAVIVPAPGSNDIYYLVTIDELFGRGLQYNVVDMRLDGGRGDVVTGQKNRPLLQTGTEKLEVVPHANGSDFWIVTHDDGEFYAFLLRSTGFSPAVVSTVGGNLANTAGHLKVNRQFNRLACGSLFEGQMRLFNFDNSTGIVRDELGWQLAPAILKSTPLIYGVEFSPSGRFLYISNLAAVVQYDLSQPNVSAVEQSAYELPARAFGQPASLQLAPDKKIYLNAGSLDVIECPDQPGVGCGYRPAVLNGGGYGLPKWVPGADETSGTLPNAIVASDSCVGSTAFFRLKDSSAVSAVSWNFGDSGAGSTNTAVGNSANHVFSQPGVYRISAFISGSCSQDTLFLPAFKVVKCSSSGTLKITSSPDSCLQRSVAFDVSGNLRVDAVIGWDFGDPASGSQNSSALNKPEHTFTAAGTYNVRCFVRINCSKQATSGNPVIQPCFYVDTFRTMVKVVACTPTVVRECPLLLPNTFSPNDDGTNDQLELFASCIPETYELSVFDRWGGMVFRTSNLNEFWNGRFEGTDCPQGIYVTVLRYRFRSKPETTVYGNVTLLR